MSSWPPTAFTATSTTPSSPNEKTSDFKMKYPKEIETASEILQPVLQEKIGEKLKSRWVALKLLEGNTPIISQINEFLGYDILQDFAVSKTLDSANEYLSEKGISKQGEHVFHVHEYSAPGIDNRQPARNITTQEYEKYKKFFKGVK